MLNVIVVSVVAPTAAYLFDVYGPKQSDEHNGHLFYIFTAFKKKHFCH
jgi:hypothetical protein